MSIWMRSELFSADKPESGELTLILDDYNEITLALILILWYYQLLHQGKYSLAEILTVLFLQVSLVLSMH
ncbi:hypothetical protein CS542_04405, partial [Pedobacter sp. IW39]